MKITRTYLSSVLSMTLMAQTQAVFSAGENFALEEITVTAQRRTQNLQDVPVSVTGFSDDNINDLNIETADDVAAHVPNFQVSSPFGDVQPLFSIRGVSMPDYNTNQQSPIGVYVDEAYLGATVSHGLSLFDLERIEVLRGPQGTLYGKNTTGGAINFITKTPEVDDEINGYLKVGYGNLNTRTGSAAIEGTLVEGSLAGRLAATSKKDDGFYENKLGGGDLGQTDYWALRGTLNWQVNENASAVLKYSTARSDGSPSAFQTFGHLAGGADTSGYVRPASLDFHEGEINGDGPSTVDLDIAILTVNYELDNYTLTSVSSWSDVDSSFFSDIDGSPASVLHNTYSTAQESVSQDFRIASNFDGNINFITGIYYGKESLNLQVLYEILEDALPFFGVTDQRTETTKATTAAYSQVRFDLTDNLGFDIGLRYTKDDIDLDYINVSQLNHDGTPMGTLIPGNITEGTASPVDGPFAFSPGPVFLGGPYTLASGPTYQANEEEITGKINVDYVTGDGEMVYANYSRGYRSGSYDGGGYYLVRSFEEAYADPEFVDAYEVGFKGDYIDGSLRINGALFYLDYTDQQIISGRENISTILENAGNATIKGLETEVWWRASENLSLRAAVGLLDTEYGELTLRGDDLSGNELISAPEVSFNIAGDYSLPINTTLVFKLHVDANYQAQQWFSAYNDVVTPDGRDYSTIEQESYWLLNARLGFDFGPDEDLSVFVWGKNLADKEYYVYGINLRGPTNADLFTTGAPRTFGLGIEYAF
jgi:iron complex outermembrane recepter protein